MKFLLIFLVIVVIAVVLLRMRRVAADQAAPPASPPPPGTRDLDEETAERPEIAAEAMAAARARVSQEVPDEVLADVLLDATPQQAAKLFATVSPDVMAGAIGQQTTGVHIQGEAKAEDLAQLSHLSESLDDLDIWSFGDEPKKA